MRGRAFFREGVAQVLLKPQNGPWCTGGKFNFKEPYGLKFRSDGVLCTPQRGFATGVVLHEIVSVKNNARFS